ncbi:MAG TPA: hypothetical protein VHO90_18235 [Bacteroidales bacterium]|nr:hypothetical protein [Bacteroidales bacterium]
MIQKVFIVACIVLFVLPVKSQHLIGKTKVQIEKEMEESYADFDLDRSTVNHVYKYLKYVNKISEETFLVFLTPDDICSATKLTSDYANLPQVKKKLSKYKPAGKNKWVYVVDGVKYTVKLKEEKWFFSVFTSKN